MEVLRVSLNPCSDPVETEPVEVLIRNINIKCSPIARLTRGGNHAIVVLYNFLYNGQPNASACIFFFSMKPLKDLENTLAKLWIEPNAIVRDLDMEVVFFN